MTVDLVSLAVIGLIAACTPILARLIPGRVIPETVFLLIAGALLGPYLLDFIRVDVTISFLSDLGLSFLFLLAGYEIDVKNLTGSQGKRGLGTWVVTAVIAFGTVRLIPALSANSIEGIAVAIALTTTALGALLPIMKERGLAGTRIGNSVLSYGTWGELCPVIVMALLLSTRQTWKTVVILIIFVAIAVITARFSSRARKAEGKFFLFLVEGAETTSQTFVRVTILLLVGLVTVTAIFDLDIVLGAFAAGFVLRHIIPEGNTQLEEKIDGIAYGFFIPLFFVVSGANINLAAVVSKPMLLIGFIFMLLLIRAVPIFVGISTGKDTREMSASGRISVALYCTTALPLIVAVTTVAVTAGAMAQDTASVLVSAGAVTMLIMPLFAALIHRVADVKPLEALNEIKAHPKEARSIIHDHLALERMLVMTDKVLKKEGVMEGDEDEDWVTKQDDEAAKAMRLDKTARVFADEQRRRIKDHRQMVHDIRTGHLEPTSENGEHTKM